MAVDAAQSAAQAASASGLAKSTASGLMIAVNFGARFFVFQATDQRTDAFSEIGSMYGSKQGFYLLTGPDWTGTAPPGIAATFRSPTNIGTVIPRVFQADDPADNQAVQSLLRQIMAYPLAEFDGSVVAERTAGEVSARCHDEEANNLALNLAHDIVTGEKTVDEARAYYAKEFLDYRRGLPTPYMDELRFEPRRDTPDADERVLSDQDLADAEAAESAAR